MKKARKIIKKFGLDKIIWTYKGFHGVLSTFYPVIDAVFHPNHLKYFGRQNTMAIFFIFNNYIHWYWSDVDMKQLREKMILKIKRQPNFLKKFLADWQKKLKLFYNLLPLISKERLKKISDEQLLRLFNDFYSRFIDEFSMMMAVADAFSMHADRFLEPAFKKFLKNNFEKYFSILISPIDKSFINLEEDNRLRILKEIEKNIKLFKIFSSSPKNKIPKLLDKFPLIKKKLQNHVRNFFWLRNNYAYAPYLNEKFFIGELKEMIRNQIEPEKALKEGKQKQKTIGKQKKELIKKLRLPAKLKLYIKLSEIFFYGQDRRKQALITSFWYQNLFRDEFARRLKVEGEEVKYALCSELIDLLLNKTEYSRKEWRERKKHCLVVGTPNGSYIYSGKEVEEIHRLLFLLKQERVKEISGMIASRGVAKGRVKIIRKTHDLINMKSGDILVASMTRPEMVTAVKKASAIITDEGGITCHAAIISRELGIPCIIGTKVATQVLRDGDLVEVDADKGLVKIIK